VSYDALDLGAALRALRRRADLSQRELARRARVPQSTVARIESDRPSEPHFGTVVALVRAAGGDVQIVDAPPATASRSRRMTSRGTPREGATPLTSTCGRC
jgi:transcriptional regulator with XRE-family HTH domain